MLIWSLDINSSDVSCVFVLVFHTLVLPVTNECEPLSKNYKHVGGSRETSETLFHAPLHFMLSADQITESATVADPQPCWAYQVPEQNMSVTVALVCYCSSLPP